MAAETEKTGWKIDGVIYEDPEKFTTAEHRIIKRYTGLDFNALDKKTGIDLMGDQDFLAAMMHIAYRREHRELSFDQIEEVVGDVDLQEAMSTLGSGEGDADPPVEESTSKPDESSVRSSTGSSESSGNGSSESSEVSGKTHSVTTTAESGTSSLVSAAGT